MPTPTTRQLRIASNSVAALSVDRLSSVLDARDGQRVDIVALPETRSRVPQIGWARGLCSRRGWLPACAYSPGRLALGAIAYGGTAVFLSRSGVGKGIGLTGAI